MPDVQEKAQSNHPSAIFYLRKIPVSFLFNGTGNPFHAMIGILNFNLKPETCADA